MGKLNEWWKCKMYVSRADCSMKQRQIFIMIINMDELLSSVKSWYKKLRSRFGKKGASLLTRFITISFKFPDQWFIKLLLTSFNWKKTCARRMPKMLKGEHKTKSWHISCHIWSTMTRMMVSSWVRLWVVMKPGLPTIFQRLNTTPVSGIIKILRQNYKKSNNNHHHRTSWS